MGRVCSIDGCGNPMLARGWCSKHYMRWRTHGSPHHTNDLSTEERFWAKVDRGRPDDCWCWTAHRDRKGYGGFRREAKRRTTAHRYSYVLHYGEIPDGMCVMHLCDQPACVNPAHLSLGTVAENNADAARKWRKPLGSRNPRAKLAEADVLAIRERYAKGGVSQSMLAREYSVDRASIQHTSSRGGPGSTSERTVA